MKKFGRRIMALTLAGAMMCAPMTAFATEATSEATSEASSPVQDTVTGSGSVEDIIEMEIFKVVLPTVSVTSGETTTSVLDFILDPQKLLKTTDTSSTYSDSTLFFANAPADPSGSVTYSATSDALTITNKSTHAVDVYLDASVSGLADSGVDLAAASTWTNDVGTPDIDESKAKELYLAITTAKKDVDGSSFTDIGSATAITSSGYVGSAVTLNPAKTGSYELKKSTEGDYSYDLKSTATAADFAHMNVKFTGACNSAADWKTTDATLAPQLNLTWTIVKSGAGKDSITPPAPTAVAPSIPATATFTKGTATEVSISLGTGSLAVDGVTSVTACNTQTGTYTTISGLAYNSSSSVITIPGTLWSGASSGNKRYVKVVLSDNSEHIIEVTIQ